jgi:hypothetical protein
MSLSTTAEVTPRESLEPKTSWSSGVPFRSLWELEALRGVFRTEALPRGWDSYGSLPPALVAVNRSLGLLRGIAELDLPDLPVPDVAPVPGGGIQFEWGVGQRELEFEILPDGSVEYLKAEGGEPVEQGALALSRVHSILAWLVAGG